MDVTTQQPASTPGLTPRISIVIPTLNSGRTLDACLAAIRTQEPPAGGYEIVMADAG